MQTKTIFRCGQCGRETSQWLGQCPSCENWNSFAPVEADMAASGSRRVMQAAKARRQALSVLAFTERADSKKTLSRWKTGFGQIDQCLGGGIIEGSLVLIGGAPGIGKSTLAGQMAGAWAGQRAAVFYASGEEDLSQIALRLERLGVAKSECLFLGSSLTLEDILWKAEELKPRFLVIDSIQTVPAESLDYPAGSPALIRSIAGRLMALAKKKGVAVVLLGHVTKEGHLAGPKHLEHMVDVVLQMEKPRAEEYRIVRVMKNRFGPAGVLAVLEMQAKGLSEVTDPSASFISEDWRRRLQGESRRIGLASSFALDSGQAFLIQAEALIGKKKLSPGRRAALGIDSSRLQILIAVMERCLGISLEANDVFLSLVGGIKVRDPGVDLALLMAMGSVITEAAVATDAAFLGEVSLSGDVLPARDMELRVRQAKALGFSKIYHAREGLWRVNDFLSELKKTNEKQKT
ncbi:MAG: DNA repair protein RadA [Elusimicrobia bacterium]|nr:DNA repair protein RadA [Elusimicrobiota bacterium]